MKSETMPWKAHKKGDLVYFICNDEIQGTVISNLYVNKYKHVVQDVRWSIGCVSSWSPNFLVPVGWTYPLPEMITDESSGLSYVKKYNRLILIKASKTGGDN